VQHRLEGRLCGVDAGNAAHGPTGVGLLAGDPAGLEVPGDAVCGGEPTRSALRATAHLQTIKPIPSRTLRRHYTGWVLAC
jgi:hypothetical protein